ncbi:hypothetical protein [Butyricicoccus intestinisimiae]|uniref:Uncharacterized protein n=1 Tax=Butyricicoccus intestinisimiae TaxID=2841509 RepID=A0ABS6ESW8_9FIRM|nr:hypothetical protein [Butyricicoccus intestinisimiae]MBU5490788.1 hypothetical protein [Butyricicoccus intestinisimiae]
MLSSVMHIIVADFPAPRMAPAKISTNTIDKVQGKQAHDNFAAQINDCRIAGKQTHDNSGSANSSMARVMEPCVKSTSCEKCGKKSHKMRIKSNKTANFSRKFSRIQKKS